MAGIMYPFWCIDLEFGEMIGIYDAMTRNDKCLICLALIKLI